MQFLDKMILNSFLHDENRYIDLRKIRLHQHYIVHLQRLDALLTAQRGRLLQARRSFLPSAVGVSAGDDRGLERRG